MAYLLDTNAFFEMLCEIGGIEMPGMKGFLKKTEGEKCYISRITLIEIISVIGKYGRGEAQQWQICRRQIHENGETCGHYFLNPGRKRWKNKTVRGMIKLVNEVTTGKSSLLNIEVLPVTDAVLQEAERFIHSAVSYKFASMDAVIASTARIFEREHGEQMIVLTADKSLRRALQLEQMGMFPD